MTSNRITLLGRLGRDVETRVIPNGESIASFTLATDRPGPAGSAPVADWHRVHQFDPSPTVQAASKGDLVFVEGRMQYREWEDREGRAQWTAEVRAWQVLVLGRPQRGDAPDAPPAAPSAPADLGPAGGEEDDLPF